MKEIIYFHEASSQREIIHDLSQKYLIHSAQTIRTVIIKLLDIPNACGIFIDSAIKKDTIISLLKKLSYLNPDLPAVLIDGNIEFRSSLLDNYSNIQIETELHEVEKIFEKSKLYRRNFVRTNWPVQAQVFQSEYPKVYDEGIALSLCEWGLCKGKSLSSFVKEKPLYSSKF